MTMTNHLNRWLDCHDCPLGAAAHMHVLYDGDLRPDVLFVGEAPGEVEDALGKPFVGSSGQLLRKIISECHVATWPWTFGATNVLACKPTELGPQSDEIAACAPRLDDLIRILCPRLIVQVGAVAARNVSWGETPMVSIQHPAAVLRSRDRALGVKRCILEICTAIQELTL